MNYKSLFFFPVFAFCFMMINAQNPTDPEEQFELGRQYVKQQNAEKAAYWVKKAAEQGHAGAQAGLSGFYYLGIGVDMDYKEAVKWARKAAMQGHPSGQCMLGLYYESCVGVEKNMTEAIKWYKKAAEQDDEGAIAKLGQCYLYGNGVQKNRNEAIRLLKKAARMGEETSQQMLRQMGESY